MGLQKDVQTSFYLIFKMCKKAKNDGSVLECAWSEEYSRWGLERPDVGIWPGIDLSAQPGYAFCKPMKLWTMSAKAGFIKQNAFINRVSNKFNVKIYYVVD